MINYSTNTQAHTHTHTHIDSSPPPILATHQSPIKKKQKQYHPKEGTRVNLCFLKLYYTYITLHYIIQLD